MKTRAKKIFYSLPPTNDDEYWLQYKNSNKVKPKKIRKMNKFLM